MSDGDDAFLSLPDQLRNSYEVGNDHSLRVIYANGMETHYQTEPHILAGNGGPQGWRIRLPPTWPMLLLHVATGNGNIAVENWKYLLRLKVEPQSPTSQDPLTAKQHSCHYGLRVGRRPGVIVAGLWWQKRFRAKAHTAQSPLRTLRPLGSDGSCGLKDERRGLQWPWCCVRHGGLGAYWSACSVTLLCAPR